MSISPIRALSAALLLTAARACSAAPLTHLLPAKVQTVPGQTHPQAVAPEWTPFEKNPFVFGSPQEAIHALDSPDILMRRSGIEWLGRWTYTYTTYGIAPDKAACAQLSSQVGLVPKLTRAVREMPEDDSQQAARLLTVVGPSAQSAIPVVCDALVEQGSQGMFKRYEMMNSLIHLCGGPSELAPKLMVLMQAPEPETRRAAAGAAGFCDDIGFNHMGPPPTGAIVLSSSQSPIENIKFRARVMPALTRCVDDPVTSVRLAALNSLEALTKSTSDACLISYVKAFDVPLQKSFDTSWQNTLPPLARAVASQDPAVHLAALRVLAYMPGDVSSLTSSLRGGLHDDKEEQRYALAALCHAAGTNRTLVADTFLGGLSAPNLAQRRQAAADVRLMVMPLWAGGFFPDQEPLHWFGDDRLFARYGTPGLTPKQQNEEQKQRQAAQEQTQQRLLTALIQACSDPDIVVRTNAVTSLELIGQSAEAASSHGFLFAPKLKSELTVKQALIQAATLLQPTDPEKAKQFQDMSQGLWERQPWF